VDICDLTAAELAAALRRRELSATEALDAVLDRADQIGPTVNPFTMRLDERARADARAADEALARGGGGPLCGIPVTTKDSHWMAGLESTSGSRTRLGHIPPETVGAIEMLERAGAVVFARTTTPEFCYFGITQSDLFGPTANPWDLDRTSGGSSGGAGAAVAARCGPLALGGDGGGSIRIPAAFCGVVGFKPTFGMVSHEPSGPEWKTLVSVGPLARTVADARMMFAAVAGPDPRDRHSGIVGPLDQPVPPPSELRLAVSADLGFAALDDDVRQAFEAVLDQLASAGADLVPDSPGLTSSIEVWSAIALAEAHVAEAEVLAHRREELTSAAVDFLEAGGRVTMPAYVRAQFAREHIHRAYVDMFRRTGAVALLTATLGCEAFALDRTYPETIGGMPVSYPHMDWAPLLYDANLAGLPACAVPMGLGDDGLPISLQVVGPRLSDGAVLAAAEAIESLIGFSAAPDPPPSPGPPSPEAAGRRPPLAH